MENFDLAFTIQLRRLGVLTLDYLPTEDFCNSKTINQYVVLFWLCHVFVKSNNTGEVINLWNSNTLVEDIVTIIRNYTLDVTEYKLYR